MRTLVAFILIGSMIACGKKQSPAPTPDPPPVTPVPPVTPGNPDVAFWLTKTDKTALLTKQSVVLSFVTGTNTNPTITVDTTQVFQPIDGFGYTLTGGSAYLINRMATADRAAILKELFSTDDASIGVSYLRISIGASDLSPSLFSYDDGPNPVQPDSTLQNFSLAEDLTDLVPLLQQILAINPSIKILGCPWSAPVWMKDNNLWVAGSLLPKYYDSYANYFVKYIQAMKTAGITIDAVTPQNEPENPSNNPSMTLTAAQETEFIKNHLGPAFQTAGLTTKIIVYDHNCDHPVYPETVLGDPDAAKYADGSAFHLYAGDISALSTVHNAYPAKNIYFTEQYVAGPSNFGGDLDWALKNLIIGATRNWSRNVLEWNLANDPSYQPHTSGGCGNCLGAITVGSSITRNTSYYIIAHASKFVGPGSVRVYSSTAGTLQNVAFRTPDGKKVLIVLNDSGALQTFNIQFKGKIVTPSLDAGAVGTFVF